MRLAFEKYEGLGNDFVVIDARVEGVRVSHELAQRLCDRRRGVGGDGVLLVGPGRSGGAAASMVVYNADGSRPEMCGNGLRCVAHYLTGGSPASLVVDTDAGPLGCEIEGGEVRIEMGEARLGPESVELDVEGQKVMAREVNVGNPHAVLFGPYDQALFERLGPKLAVHPHFPSGANVEFVREGADGMLDVLVWERGVGPTEACGTGACAVAAAACAGGLRRYDEPLGVRLPGGALRVWVRESGRVVMQGPARRAFRGEVEV